MCVPPDGSFWMYVSEEERWKHMEARGGLIQYVGKVRAEKALMAMKQGQAITSLREELDQMRKRVADLLAERGDRELAEAVEDNASVNSGRLVSHTPGPFDYAREEGVKYVTSYASALGLPSLKLVDRWGEEMPHKVTARTWLMATARDLRELRVSPDIIHKVLISRLLGNEKLEMQELLDDGKITSLRTFAACFLGRYGDKLSAVQKLRKLMTTKMTEEEVGQQEYNRYGHMLLKIAHAAYQELGLRIDTWEDVDKVVVVNAYLFGVPDKLSEQLMMEQLETMDQAMEKSVKWAQSQGGLSRQNRGIYAVQTGYKPKGDPTKFLCKRCKKKVPLPVKCDHCYFCFSQGHISAKCTKRGSKSSEASSGQKSKQE